MVITGSFSSATTGLSIPISGGKVNIALWGTFVATCQIERSFDNGANWTPISRDATGTLAAWSAPVGLVIEECEGGQPPGPGALPVLYRWNCTAFTSGPALYRIGQYIKA